LVIYPKGIWYAGVQVGDIDGIIAESIVDDKVIERLQLFAKTDESVKTTER